ncbi:MAG: glycosyltransferase [Sphingomonadaceae bacterium]|nr:glycosyltransferase [Sphingomonadaceae bacterium]
MPAWNRADTIAQAIASALAQTYPHLEVVVVDDASTDATREVVRRIAAADPRVRLIALGRNGGCAVARTVALDAARGRYVAFLDADDLWLAHKIERQIDALRRCDAAICFGGYRRFRSDPERAGPLVAVPRSVTYRELLRSNVIGTLTCVVDRARTGRFAMVRTGHDDYATWLSLLRPGRWAVGIRDDLARYRLTPGSLSSVKLRSWGQTWDIYRRCERIAFWNAIGLFLSNGVSGLLKHVTTSASWARLPVLRR